MILEVATLAIKVDAAVEFEQAFSKARAVITRSEGCGAVRLLRSIENAGLYVLEVEWDSVEHHMEGFRNSPLFTEWRGILGPFFAGPPEVQHAQVVA